MSDAVTVRPKDWVPFRCRLCGSCCRDLRGNLMPEQLDAYRLARFLRERGEVEFMEDFYTKYTYPDMLEGFFPIFLMNIAGPDDSCVFLENGRCSVYEARPRVCRLYPFTAFPGQRGKAFNFFPVYGQPLHSFLGWKNLGQRLDVSELQPGRSRISDGGKQQSP